MVKQSRISWWLFPNEKRATTYPQLHYRSPTTIPRYPRLDNIEDLEKYCPGEYHPVSIGDVFAKGRYKAVHKLGFGGSSTVWLAREQCSGWFREDFGSLLTLKAMSAKQSSKPTSEIPDLFVPKALESFAELCIIPAESTCFSSKTISYTKVQTGPTSAWSLPSQDLAYPLCLNVPAECRAAGGFVRI